MLKGIAFDTASAYNAYMRVMASKISNIISWIKAFIQSGAQRKFSKRLGRISCLAGRRATRVYAGLKSGAGMAAWKQKRKLILAGIVPFSLFVICFLALPHPAYAFFGWISDDIMDSVKGALLGAGQEMFKGGIWAVNEALSFTSGFLNHPDTTLRSWQTVRTMTLGLFGVAILIIAFMNLMRLQIQVWGVNRMIPKLFLAIFLVIFSKFLCISIVNAATALANTFLSSLTNPQGQAITQGSAFGPFNNLISGGGLSIFNSDGGKVALSTAFGVFFFSAITFFVLLILAAILYFRAVVIGLLIITSPLAFALTVLPWTQKYFQEWWKKFLSWTFFFPVCILILFIGFSMIPGQPIDQSKGQTCPAGQTCSNFCTSPNNPPGCIVPYSPADGEDQATAQNTSGFFGMLASLFVGLVAVVLSVYLPLKMLGAFGNAMQGGLRKFGSLAKDIPGLKTGKRAYFNPGTYKRMWDARAAKKKEAWAEDAEAKLQGIGAKLAGPDGKRKGFRSLVTGIDTRSQQAYVKKQLDALNTAVNNPKALGAGAMLKNAIARGADQDTINHWQKKWDEQATDEQKEDFEELYKSLGSNRNALVMKAAGVNAHFDKEAFSHEYKRADGTTYTDRFAEGAMKEAGIMNKDGIIVGDATRKQVGVWNGKGVDPAQLGAKEAGGMKAYAWELLSDEIKAGNAKGATQAQIDRKDEAVSKLSKIDKRRVADWIEHGNLTQEQVNAMHGAFTAAEQHGNAAILEEAGASGRRGQGPTQAPPGQMSGGF